MKKVFSVIVATMALALSSLAVPPAVLPLPAAAYSYKSGLIETFDSMQMSTKAPMLNGQTLWSVFANGVEYAQNLIVSTNDTWGGETKGFNAGTGTDRMLAFGKTGGVAENSFLIAGFSNETGKNLTEIELYYDLECCWIRTKSLPFRSAELVASISTNGVTWSRLPALDATVSNTNANQALIWLSDAEMDRQSLAKRNIGGIISLPETVMPIKPGQKFYIRWATTTASSCKNMTYGIDNLRTFTDSDNDGLSDTKEASLGTNPNKADSDGDGMSDGDEIAYGTNPLDSTSTFSVEMKSAPSQAPSTGENNTVDFPAADGKYYTLLFSESMTGTFTPVPGSIRLTGKKGERLYCIHSTETAVGFYKVLIEAN